MFVYLSKKIALPNNTRLNCLSWNKEHGYIAVGGDDGLLKVLKLEQATTPSQNRGLLAAPSNLSMNQTLDGHKAAVQVVIWNESQQKLTTSDRDGVIMVWTMYKGSWYEEMTNDRKKSIVRGMAWTPDGQRICIVYEDGAIIVGSVDGNRIWGKELKNTYLTGVQWSPDGRLLLFSLRNGEIHLYDNQGSFVMKLNIQCVTITPSRNITVVGLAWFTGVISGYRPILAICYETGHMQIMRNENDESPIIIDCQMQAISCAWNHDGTILAVCGMKSSGISDKDVNEVMFYSPFGMHLRTLKVPGREITFISWEGKSLRISLAVDSFIYFANIRPDYLWCYFGKTVAFLQPSNYRDGSTIVFWDTNASQCFQKRVENPIAMVANADHCVIAVEPTKIDMKEGENSLNDNRKETQMYQLLICNSMSTTVDSKLTNLKPQYLAMNSSHVIIASTDEFLLWQYHTSKSSSSLHSLKIRKDKRFHIDDSPSGVVEVLNDLDKNGYEPPFNSVPTKDPICSIAASEKCLLLGRESGLIQEYTIPHVALANRYTLLSRPFKLAINCNSTRAAVVDSTGVLTTIDLTSSTAGRDLTTNISGRIERKDVWGVCWAKDNPHFLAFMEKTRMYVFRGTDPEEPISCSGYICNFEDLEITSVLLDDIINGAIIPNANDHLVQSRVKSLRDTEELLNHVGIAEAKQFIEENPHPRLWRLLAEASLRILDLVTAESSFVRCTNYPGLQLIKRLKTIKVECLQNAEVAAFYGDFDDAEKLYIDADRRDLAIGLRQTLCDWFRTVQLYRMGPGISDQQMEQAWKEIGSHFANLRSWESAKEYYEKSHYIEGLMESLYHLEQYDRLEQCINKLTEKNQLLGKLGQMFASVGMSDQAVACYLKLGDVKLAVNTCVNLRQWGQAVELAQKYKMPQVGVLLEKHAAQLLREGRLPEAVELQRKAGRHIDAARLLIKLADGEIKKKSDYLRIKKIFILACALTEDYLKLRMSTSGETRSSVLNVLSPEDAVLIDLIWHSAEAYHFILLAQRQLKSGLIQSAVLTAMRLRNYEDVLNVEDIYTILALASCAARAFGTCSKALIKLESLENISENKRQEFEEIAVNIFSKHDPYDKRTNRIECSTCDALVSDWYTACPNCGTHFQACIFSGKSIINSNDIWLCHNCLHCAYQIEVNGRVSCPFCHAAVVSTKRD